MPSFLGLRYRNPEKKKYYSKRPYSFYRKNNNNDLAPSGNLSVLCLCEITLKSKKLEDKEKNELGDREDVFMR